MKTRTLSLSVAALTLIAGQASADLVFPGASCDTTITHDAPVVRHQLITVNGPTEHVITCPMPKTTAGTTGLARGLIRFHSRSPIDSCWMRSLTQYGSVMVGTSVALTPENQDAQLNIAQHVTSSAAYGYYALGCVLSHGSTLYSYRYQER